MNMKDLGYNERTGEFVYLPGGTHRKHKWAIGAMALIIVALLILLFYVWSNSRNSIYKRRALYNIELYGYIQHVRKDIGFTMKLKINKNEVIGTEHYNNQKRHKTLQIKGTFNDGIMTLYEYVNNSKVGEYYGKFNSTSYSGIFTDKKGKQYSFTASVKDEETNAIINKKEPSFMGLALSHERTNDFIGTELNEYNMVSNNILHY